MGYDEHGRFISLGGGKKLYTKLKDSSPLARQFDNAVGKIVAFTRPASKKNPGATPEPGDQAPQG